MLRRIIALGLAIPLTVSTLGLSLGLGFATGAAHAAGEPAVQILDWQPCSDSNAPLVLCARLERPLDRSRPSGPKVSIAMAKVPATGTPQERIGTLFMNPGGPGGAGAQAIGLANLMPEELRDRFDFVSWDPRGIGQTTPAIKNCTGQMPTRPATGPVNWQQVLNERIVELTAVNNACIEGNREVIQNAGTVDVAHDLDAMRRAVGDDALSFWGISYGTMIGSTYAQLFPDKVRALVLDGNMNPQTTLLELASGSSATDDSIGYFFEVHPQLKPMFDQVMASLDRTVLQLPGGDEFTRWDLADVTAGGVASTFSWGTVSTAIRTAHAALFASRQEQQAALQALADDLDLRSPAQDSNTGIFSAVLCQDFRARPGRAAMTKPLQRAVAQGPIYGGSLAVNYLATCSGYKGFPAQPVPKPKRYGPVVPGLVLNATRDAQTPYAWAVNMARTYPSMRMVTSPSGLHGTFPARPRSVYQRHSERISSQWRRARPRCGLPVPAATRAIAWRSP